MKERIKALRKELDLTQQQFSDRLGISRNNIAGYETGKSEPGDAVILLICREFNVNEQWLRTGQLPMYQPMENDLIARASKMLGERDAGFEMILNIYSRLTPQNRKLLVNFFKNFAEAVEEENE